MWPRSSSIILILRTPFCIRGAILDFFKIHLTGKQYNIKEHMEHSPIPFLYPTSSIFYPSCIIHIKSCILHLLYLLHGLYPIIHITVSCPVSHPPYPLTVLYFKSCILYSLSYSPDPHFSITNSCLQSTMQLKQDLYYSHTMHTAQTENCYII